MTGHDSRNRVSLNGGRLVVTAQMNVFTHDGVQARVVKLDKTHQTSDQLAASQETYVENRARTLATLSHNLNVLKAF